MNPSRNMGVPSSHGNLVPVPLNQTLGGSQPHFTNHLQFSDQRGSALGHTLSQPQGHQTAFSQFQGSLQAQPAQGQLHLSHNQIKTQGLNNVGPGTSPSGSGSARRATPKPPSKLQASSNPNVSSPLKTMELAPAARRCKQKRKVPEKHIPRDVANLIPESAIYSELVNLEARVDAVLKRKKLDFQDFVKNPPHFRKTLRIFVFNTFSSQSPQQNNEGKSDESSSWTLKIMGRILEENAAEIDSDSAGIVEEGKNRYPKFTSFFKKITIYLDQGLYPDNHVITWENSRSRALHEGFEVKRKGDKEFNAIVRLELNCVPERFKLSPALSHVLGFEIETRSKVVTALWHYVKSKKLQDPSDLSVFMCDPPLRKVFGDEKIKFVAASLKLSQHLAPVPPIQLQHTIKVSGNTPSGTTCYDVPVDVPFPLHKEMSKFLSNIDNKKEVNAYDEAISSAIAKINEHRRRRAFFLGFSQSPADFINALIASQERDLKTVAGDAVRNAEKEHSADYFNQTWVEDAIVHYLNRKPSMGANAGGST